MNYLPLFCIISKDEVGKRVYVCGYGKENGDFYKNLLGVIVEFDSYYKDFILSDSKMVKKIGFRLNTYANHIQEKGE